MHIHFYRQVDESKVTAQLKETSLYPALEVPKQIQQAQSPFSELLLQYHC